jgi:hypothetical protein
VYSAKTLPRPVRVLMLEASVFTLMASTALVFNLAYPDPHPCATYEDGAACESGMNPWQRGWNTCRWSAYCLRCFYHDPNPPVPLWVWLSVVATAIASLFHTWVLKPLILGALLPPTKRVSGVRLPIALKGEHIPGS